MMLDKMGPATNHPKNAILSLAARSVISKRDRDATSIAGNSKEYKKYNQIIEEESKLIDKYYKDYYGGQKNGSTRSRGSSTDSKHDVKGKKQLEMHFNPALVENNVLNRQSMDSIVKYPNNLDVGKRDSQTNLQVHSAKAGDTQPAQPKLKAMTEEEVRETLAKLELK